MCEVNVRTLSQKLLFGLTPTCSTGICLSIVPLILLRISLSISLYVKLSRFNILQAAVITSDLKSVLKFPLGFYCVFCGEVFLKYQLNDLQYNIGVEFWLLLFPTSSDYAYDAHAHD